MGSKGYVISAFCQMFPPLFAMIFRIYVDIVYFNLRFLYSLPSFDILHHRRIQIQSCICFESAASFRCLKNALPYSYDVIIMAHAGATLATRAVIPVNKAPVPFSF